MQPSKKPLAALLAALLLLHGVPSLAFAETTEPAPAAAPQPPTFKPEELEQLVAPIALYPDPLLAQVLMASTYPLEVVEAARWQTQNSALKDKALEDALLQQTWDPSVKSLTAFPPVLTMLNDKLDWTQKLGDAFLSQQNDVMEAVQRLRAKAAAAGNLESNAQQSVTVEQAPANVQQTVIVEGQPAPPPQIIKIEPAQPEVIYVPTYNPTVAYGAWPYPASPPYSYYPPGYAATSVISFGVGMAVGASLWGGCNWGWGGNNDVNINVNRYNNFNHTNISNNNWQHNVDHRKGVQYRDNATREKYNRGVSGGSDSREAFRGRADQGRQDIARGAAKDYQTKPAVGDGGARQAAPKHDKPGAGKSAGARPAVANREKPAGGTKSGGGQPAAKRAQPQPQRQAASSKAPTKKEPPAFQGRPCGGGPRSRTCRRPTGRAARTSAAVPAPSTRRQPRPAGPGLAGRRGRPVRRRPPRRRPAPRPGRARGSAPGAGSSGKASSRGLPRRLPARGQRQGHHGEPGDVDRARWNRLPGRGARSAIQTQPAPRNTAMVRQAARARRVSKRGAAGESSVRRTTAAAPVTAQASASGLRAIQVSSAAGKAASAAGCAQNEETESVDAQEKAAARRVPGPGGSGVTTGARPAVAEVPAADDHHRQPGQEQRGRAEQVPDPAARDPRRHDPRHRQRGEQRQHGEGQHRHGHRHRRDGGGGVRCGPLPADGEL